MTETVAQELYFAIIPKAVVYHPDLRASDIRVYATLSERAGSKMRAWPGIRKIAADIHMSPDTVQQSVRRLEEAKVIEIDRSPNRSNHYWLPQIGVPEIGTPRMEGVPETGTGVYRKPAQGVPEIGTELNQITKPIELDPVIAPKAQSDLDALKAVLVEVFGEPPPQGWSLFNRVATWIRDRGGTPDDVRDRAARLAAEWGVKAATATALEKHWTRYDAAVGQVSDRDVEEYQSNVRRLTRAKKAQELDAQARGLPR